MEQHQILALYRWGIGVCVRHPAAGPIHTARAGVIHVEGGAEVEVRVCRDCMMRLEGEAATAAARRGWKYRPGRVGQVP